MLRLDIDRPEGARTYYVTPFVTDGDRLFMFDEPGDRSDAFDDLLLGHGVTVSSHPTGSLAVSDVARRANPVEEAWARDACTARFFYDQALQDTAQLGTLVVLGPPLDHATDEGNVS